MKKYEQPHCPATIRWSASSVASTPVRPSALPARCRIPFASVWSSVNFTARGGIARAATVSGFSGPISSAESVTGITCRQRYTSCGKSWIT